MLTTKDESSPEDLWHSVPTSGPGERKEIIGPVIGALVVAIAVSGLLDDSGGLVHPWWVVLLVTIAVVGLLLGARTLRMLLE